MATRLLIGRSFADTIGAFGVFLLFSYALSWGCACLGIVSKGPESAQGIGLIILFPLSLVSNATVPTEHMPAVLRVLADWNPVSAVTAAARELFHNVSPSGTIHAWPMQLRSRHRSSGRSRWFAIFAPLDSLLYRRRTAD